MQTIFECDDSRQYRMLCVIISLYLTYGKGGSHDTHGRIHYNRGGSEKAPSACGYRQAEDTRGGNPCLQGRETLAYQSVRTGTNHSRGSQQEITRGTLSNLAFLPVAATRSTFVVVQATNGDLACSRYLLSILSCLATKSNIEQHGSGWLEGDTPMLAIYRGRFYLLRPSTQPRCTCGKPATYQHDNTYFCGHCIGRIALTLQHYTIDTKSRGGEAG